MNKIMLWLIWRVEQFNIKLMVFHERQNQRILSKKRDKHIREALNVDQKTLETMRINYLTGRGCPPSKYMELHGKVLFEYKGENKK